MISIQELYKRYGKKEVLHRIETVFAKGKLTVVLGPNGSGKTTLIKSILGLVIPEKGQVAIDGEKTTGKHLYREKIGYLPQINQFPGNLKVEDLLHFLGTLSKSEPILQSELVDALGLTPYLKQKIRTLSGGTLQKVNLVQAFMHDAPYLILDEPTSGLDPLTLLKFKELIQEARGKGKTIIITTHVLELVEEMADEIIFILDGKVYFQGKLKELNQETGQNDLLHSMAQVLSKKHVENI